MNKKIIFRLDNVNVEFERHSLAQRSLRSALGRKLNRHKSEKIAALKNINLEIREGENIGVIGRNGAGKSTLLRVLTKVIIPCSGKVQVDNSKHIVPLLELGIGFQPDLSGRENCFVAGMLIGYSKKEIEEKMNSIIDFAELRDFIDEPVKNYSSGMYARLAFALATDINPQVLLVDEVFGVGDEFFMKKCMIRMQELMNNGLTTIFISHNLDFLISQSNRLIWFDGGEIKLDGNPFDVAEAYRNSDNNLKLVVSG
ncbi:MAG: ABC transporter ATP-binding protein [Ignavibacteria bacterium]|nr:ABC transporter ATP-binding protein [Ignavibacteria bacterium]